VLKLTLSQPALTCIEAPLLIANVPNAVKHFHFLWNFVGHEPVIISLNRSNRFQFPLFLGEKVPRTVAAFPAPDHQIEGKIGRNLPASGVRSE
jgi:hypothetical protein